jgi:hypothetical protein
MDKAEGTVVERATTAVLLWNEIPSSLLARPISECEAVKWNIWVASCACHFYTNVAASIVFVVINQ